MKQIFFLATIAIFTSSFACGQQNHITPNNSNMTSTLSKGMVTRFPFELLDNTIFVPVSVNNSKSLSFILDTGATNTLIKTSIAEELGLKMGESGFGHGAGGQVQYNKINGVNIKVGEAKLENINIDATAIPPFELSSGHISDGVLGADFFKRYVVEIDFETSQISAYEPAEYNYQENGEVFPIDFSYNHPYMRANITMPGHEPIEGIFIVDIGSSFPLILMPKFIEENKIRESLPSTLETYARGGDGAELILPVGRAKNLQLGKFNLESPVAILPTSGMFGRPDAIGNIGSAVLRRFKVIFDYSRQRMILEPNTHFAEPFEYDMSGLQLITEAPALKTILVSRVLPNSPAEDAGIKKGDEIISFNNQPAVNFKLPALRELLRQPDKEYPLVIKRNNETISIKLRTRRLI